MKTAKQLSKQADEFRAIIDRHLPKPSPMIEISPDHTLIGHEYAVNEDFEKAMMSFRTALSCDDRHYNAWYGLGTVFFREEKYDLAEYHFKRAVVINSRNPVLHCYLGMVRHTLSCDFILC